MFLLDDLLSLPLSGLKFVFRTLRQVAEEQYTDTGPIKERLLELQLQLESEEISEAEYVQRGGNPSRASRDRKPQKGIGRIAARRARLVDLNTGPAPPEQCWAFQDACEEIGEAEDTEARR
jgi:Gas vesicle protein G